MFHLCSKPQLYLFIANMAKLRILNLKKINFDFNVILIVPLCDVQDEHIFCYAPFSTLYFQQYNFSVHMEGSISMYRYLKFR